MSSGTFRESKLQSEKDQEQIRQIRDYISESVSDDFDKFDNFSKYVPRSALSRFLGRHEVFKLQLSVPGCILDLGVGRGASLFTWSQLSEIYEPVNYTREIIGFDTFQGISVIDDRDKNAHNADSNLLKKGGFRVEEGIYEDIQQAISIYDAGRLLGHIPKVRVVKGDINETLPDFVDENPQLLVSLLHIDVDLYRPAKIALDLLHERIPKGGVILFDELNAKNYPGETVALREALGIDALRLKRFPWSTTMSYAIVD